MRIWLVLTGFLLLGACGAEGAPKQGQGGTAADPITGTWRGLAGDVAVTVNVRVLDRVLDEGIVSGTLSTSKTTCFGTGQLEGVFDEWSVTWLGTFRRPSAESTLIHIEGPRTDSRTIDGLFGMVGGPDGCFMFDIPLRLTH